MRNENCPMYNSCHLDCDECRSAAFYMNEGSIKEKEYEDTL